VVTRREVAARLTRAQCDEWMDAPSCGAESGGDNDDGPRSKIFDKADFGYARVTIERPLRLRYQMTTEDKARFLDACPHLLAAVRAATERTIALLKQRRSGLIAAAVTGRLDVGAMNRAPTAEGRAVDVVVGAPFMAPVGGPA